MRPLIALAVALIAASAVRAEGGAPAAAAQAVPDASPQANWRRDTLEDRVKTALTGQGWRFEDDGRALDPRTKAPASKAALDKAVLDLRMGARQAALEAANLMLASGKPLDFEDRSRLQTLAADLPPGLADAMLDPKSDLNQVKRLAGENLARVAAYFDGGRTLADRTAAAQPVSAGAPGPRVDLPYYTARERSVGDKLRAGAAETIARDPFGRVVLARLDGADGKPALPPVVIEDQGGSVVAQYDFRRGAVVLDRERVTASIVATAPPRRAAALRASLATRADLLAYLDAHPEAVAAVVRANDAVLVHELTHAWQDRRDTLLREIARGNVPDVQPLEYEEEAYKTKNLYIHSKLKNDPASVPFDEEFRDYVSMAHGPESWKAALITDLRDASPSRALPLRSVREIERERLERAKARAVGSADQQQAKALDLLALTRGEKELAALETEHSARMIAVDAAVAKTSTERYDLLASYYLMQARSAARSTDRSAWLDQAERYARASGNAALLEEIRKTKDSAP